MEDILYKDNTSGYNPAMPKTDPFNFRFPKELMDKMTVHAKREGRSRNNLIEHLMRAYDADTRIQDLARQYVDPVPPAD